MVTPLIRVTSVAVSATAVKSQQTRLKRMASDGNHLRLVGAVGGIGSGLTKVAVGHGLVYNALHLERIVALLTACCKPFGMNVCSVQGCDTPAVGWAAIDSLLLGSLHNYRLFLVRHGMTEPVPGKDIERLTLTFAVKLQLQMQRSAAERQFKGPIDCARQIVRVHGVPGLWTGFTGSLACRSNFLWMFLSFEALMRGFATLQGTPYEISTPVANFLSGGLASFAFWMMAIPADNVKK
ncbi:Mitochondrial substrate carrier family protein S [Grifola frondosa]|uniref:Mitochondrial substrate carrier family protein S n=1 Tax=Grifola frondosa TaxID=5627 RepID=A0A1C7MUD3_GRIFR|nr:Mitochondrial substrate carrier family protein S [Grifola frondosa]